MLLCTAAWSRVRVPPRFTQWHLFPPRSLGLPTLEHGALHQHSPGLREARRDVPVTSRYTEAHFKSCRLEVRRLQLGTQFRFWYLEWHIFRNTGKLYLSPAVETLRHWFKSLYPIRIALRSSWKVRYQKYGVRWQSLTTALLQVKLGKPCQYVHSERKHQTLRVHM